jgi:hypothetical protein
MKHVALAAILLALAPACHSTTGKVAGVVALSSLTLGVTLVGTSCGTTDGDECVLLHNIGGAALLGLAGVAGIVTAISESRYHAEAPQPIAREIEPAAPAPRSVSLRQDPRVVELSTSASIEASLGRCATVAVLGDQIRSIDPAYYRAVFLVDPTIARCR